MVARLGSLLLLIMTVAPTEATDRLVTSRPIYVRFDRQDTAARHSQEEPNSTALPTTPEHQQRNMEVDQDPMADGFRLGNDFLRLFDEIWRIKRQSLMAIAQNQEFAERAKQQTQASAVATTTISRPATTNLATTEDPDLGDDHWLQHNLLSATVSMKGVGLHHKQPIKLLQRQQASPQVNVKQQSSGNSLVAQMGAWLQQLNGKISKVVQVGWSRAPMAANQKQLAVANVVGNLEDSSSYRERRQVQSQEPNDNGCVPLNQEQMNECRFAELQVGTVMNSSFPANSASIDDNCRHVTFLLSNCWPEQLKLIRLAVTSGGWNESLLQTSSFQLPPLENNNGEQLISCGLKPFLADSVLDRISWMWLNFCMDKKFRRDYLEHLRCLSYWNQERAHAVCHDQWRLIQNGPSNVLSTLNSAGAKQRANNVDKQKQTLMFPQVEPTGEVTLTTIDYMLALIANASATAATTNTTNTTVATSGRHVTQELQTRDLESKTICCMFDLFLRCVHRQALRDCGRSGAQLVVNFMARIGTDDMKWVCNSGHFAAASKTRPPQQGGPRRTSHNNSLSVSGSLQFSPAESLGPSPFIERPYCNDPKINQALRVHQSTHTNADELNKFPGNDYHHRNRPGQVGRTNTRGPMQNNNNHLQDMDGAGLASDSALSLHHHLLTLLLLVTSVTHYLSRL